MLGLNKIPFVGISTKSHQFLLIESGIVRHVHIEERDNGYGPYTVGVIVDEKTGETGKFLIELKDYTVQEALLLVDHKVRVLVRSNGSKLKPLELQFPEIVELISAYRAKTEFKLNTEELNPVKNSVDTYQSAEDKDSNADAIETTTTAGTPTPSATVTTTATGTPTPSATGTPTPSATGTTTAAPVTPPVPAIGEETEAKNEVLDLEVSDQEDNLNLLENLMATATQKCHDLGLPMFIGICLPPKKYKK